MNGYAFRTEWPFWVFETIPMIFAIGVFCVWHPSQYLPRSVLIFKKKGKSKKQLSVEMTANSEGSRDQMV